MKRYFPMHEGVRPERDRGWLADVDNLLPHYMEWHREQLNARAEFLQMLMDPERDGPIRIRIYDVGISGNIATD